MPLALATVTFAAACSSSEPRRSTAAGCRVTTASPGYRAEIRRARPIVRRLQAGIRAPGMSLAVAVGRKVVWSVNCGYADVDARRPATDHTRYRIGSVSKPLTATALMRYAEVGAVDLDAPIDRYLPSFPSHGGRITLRRLAGHLAGIRHYRSRAEAVNTRSFPSVFGSLEIFAQDPLVAAPGTQFAYSSYGYDVIGAALERATGQSFESLLRRSVLTPAQLTETTLGTASAKHRATFYELTNRGGIRPAPRIDLSDRLPAGGLLSTARDLARFGGVLSEGTLVKHRTALTMFTSQKTVDGRQTGYGIGFEVHPSRLGLFVGHTGAVDGGTAALVIHPRTHAALALAANVGYATAESPPPPREGTPDPPTVLRPFITR
jgi:serine beta-lactamase-like protein LACTB